MRNWIKLLLAVAVLACPLSLLGQELVDVPPEKFPPKIVKSASATQIQIPIAPVTADATADTIITASADDKTPLVLQAKSATQSANILEFQTSAGVATAWQSAASGFTATELRVKDGYANLSAAGLVLYSTGMPIKWGTNMYGTNADLSLSRTAAGVLGVGDGGTSDALRVNASGRIYGNAVAAIGANAGNKRAVTTNVATMTTYQAHNLCAGQTITIASCGDATYNGTYIIASVPSTTTFTFALTHADEGETADAAVTMTASAQVQLGGAPTNADVDADVLIQSTGAGQVPLSVQGAVGHTDHLMDFRDSAGNVLGYTTSAGIHYSPSFVGTYGTGALTQGTLNFNSDGVIKWNTANWYDATTNILCRPEAGVLGTAGIASTNYGLKIGLAPTAFSVTDTAGVDVTLRARDANGGDRNGGSLVLTPGTNTGTGVIGRVRVTLANCPTYANNAAALAGGLVAGDLYRTGADPDPVCIVH